MTFSDLGDPLRRALYGPGSVASNTSASPLPPPPLLPKDLLQFSEHDPAGTRAGLWLELTEVAEFQPSQFLNNPQSQLQGMSLVQQLGAVQSSTNSLSQFLRDSRNDERGFNHGH